MIWRFCLAKMSKNVTRVQIQRPISLFLNNQGCWLALVWPWPSFSTLVSVGKVSSQVDDETSIVTAAEYNVASMRKASFNLFMMTRASCSCSHFAWLSTKTALPQLSLLELSHSVFITSGRWGKMWVSALFSCSRKYKGREFHRTGAWQDCSELQLLHFCV